MLTHPNIDHNDDENTYNAILNVTREKTFQTVQAHLLKQMQEGKSLEEASEEANRELVSITNKNSRKTSIGNCEELAYLALEYIAENEPTMRVETISINSPSSHMLLVLERDPNSSKRGLPSTWGESCFFCDPWAKTVFPASEFRSNLKKHRRDGNENLIIAYEEDSDTLLISEISNKTLGHLSSVGEDNKPQAKQSEQSNLPCKNITSGNLTSTLSCNNGEEKPHGAFKGTGLFSSNAIDVAEDDKVYNLNLMRAVRQKNLAVIERITCLKDKPDNILEALSYAIYNNYYKDDIGKQIMEKLLSKCDSNMINNRIGQGLTLLESAAGKDEYTTIKLLAIGATPTKAAFDLNRFADQITHGEKESIEARLARATITNFLTKVLRNTTSGSKHDAIAGLCTGAIVYFSTQESKEIFFQALRILSGRAISLIADPKLPNSYRNNKTAIDETAEILGIKDGEINAAIHGHQKKSLSSLFGEKNESPPTVPLNVHEGENQQCACTIS